VTLSRFTINRNEKFSTTSLVHRAEYHFKIDTNAAPVELMCRCSMLAGAVVPFILMRGTIITSCKELWRMSFLQKKQKLGNIGAKPRAKKSLSDHRRFIILNQAQKFCIRSRTLSNEKQSLHRTTKLRDLSDRCRSTSANQTSEGGGDAFNSTSTATKFSTISLN
jgi:hypothetical protein